MDRQGQHVGSCQLGLDGSVHTMSAHAVFESVVEKFPDRIAAVCNGERITYSELNGWANAIAWALIEAGVQPEQPVALAVPKSLAHVATVLGVLKSGGAFVPIVANQPEDRLLILVQDLDCRLAVADPAYLPGVVSSIPTVLDPAPLRDSPRPNPGRPVGPDSLAYIIYTSGSTGRPKGAMIEHSGIVRLVHGQDYMPFGPEMHFLYGGPLSFDLCIIELFTPLLHGSKLLISPDDVLTPEVVRHFAETEDLRAAFISYSLFRVLFESDPGAFERLWTLGFGGEAIDPKFVRRVQERLPETVIYAAYGPTECTALTTTYLIPRPCPLDPAVLPIGWPLARMHTRVVDDSLRRVAPGVPGELLIGGVGLARGYFNAPALTAGRFVEDPEAPGSGQCLYRSGDLVYELPDGNTAYLGRIDDQVKIRGQRIELGEIDSVVSSDPAVRSSASVVVGSGESARIGVCVVPSDPHGFDVGALTDRLSKRLTAAMMPAPIVSVDAIPLNRNGKVDREALRRAVEASEGARSATPDPQAVPATLAPRTAAERTLLGLCSRVVGRAVESMERSFVQLGGHSLQAMRLRGMIREHLGADVSLPEIISSKDLASLAGVIQSGRKTDQGSFTSIFSSGPVPVSPQQARLWTLQQFDPSSAAYNIAFGFEFAQHPDIPTLGVAWQDVVDRHPALRMRFSASPSMTPQAELLAVAEGKLERFEKLESQPERLRQEIVRPFDLGRPPLARLLVSEEPGRVIRGWLVMHHIVSDAWSMEVLLRDLAAMYRARREGFVVDLPEPLPGQPGDAERQSSLIDTPAIRRLVEDAAEEFCGRTPTYPPIRSDPGQDDSGSASTRVTISGDRYTAINRAASEAGVTPHALLLAAFASLTGRVCTTDSPVIGLAMSTRDDGPFNDAVGFFVETVPVRIDLAHDSFRALIGRTASAAQEAQRRRSVPFEQLARAAGQAGSPGRTPITEVFFNVIDRAPLDGDPDDHGFIRSDFEEIDHGLARFDLLCTVHPCPDAYTVILTCRNGDWSECGGPPTAANFADTINGLLKGTLAFGHVAESRPGQEQGQAPVAEGGVQTVVEPGTQAGHILMTILSIFREVLGDEGIGPDHSFFDRGGNSLQAVRAFAMIHERLGTKVPTSVIFRARTPAAIARTIAEDPGSLHIPTVLRMNNAPADDPLYLLPGIEGNVVSFAPHVERQGNRRACFALEYPGVHDNQNPMNSVHELAEYFMARIDEPTNGVAPDLLGYSFGGLVAFEMARRYQERGFEPGLLVLLDSYLPGSYPMRSRPERLLIHLRTIAGLSPQERLAYLRKRSKALATRFRPETGTQDEPVRNKAVVNRAHHAAIDSYKAASLYRGPVLVFRGHRPDWMKFHRDDGANGWRSVRTGPFEVVDLDGTHSHLLRAEFADQINEQIESWRVKHTTLRPESSQHAPGP